MMARRALLTMVAALAIGTLVFQTATGDDAPAPTGFHRVRLNQQTFMLPLGFTIEQVAGPPLVERPIHIAIDERGRLYATDSSGSNEKVAEQAKKKPHRIVRLEDADGDGRYEKSSIFVKNISFPEGAMWLQGSLYVAAPPQILKFTEAIDAARTVTEETWFDGQTLTGCANDLHGPYLGPDGRIYWCKGAWAKQEYALPTGKTLRSRAAHILRSKVDGKTVEPVMAGGMDNPVDTVFMPAGERIFCTTFLQQPGGGHRDGLIHAIYGGVYGKDHEPIHEHPWTSPQLMPVLSHLGPAAPSGLHRYESNQFGPEYEGNLFCTQFNMRKVSRHVLTPEGASFSSRDSDFLVSDSLDFHPTDVIEDADGSLLVVDTGGWYKLCCPTSQLVKPDVTGAIYRIRKTGGHKIDDPRGQRIDWAGVPTTDLTAYLDDPRPVVRQRAIETLALRKDAVAALSQLAGNQKFHERQRLNAVWCLARIEQSEARRATRRFLIDSDETVLRAVLHSIALHFDREAVGDASRLLGHQSLAVRRTAAEALGRIGDGAEVAAILRALADERNDRALDHSLTYALIEIAAPQATIAGLKAESPRVRRAALAALNAMPDDRLDPKAVFAELDASHVSLRETAWWIAGQHPAWGDALANDLAQRLARLERMSEAERDELMNRIIPFLKSQSVRSAVGRSLVQSAQPSVRMTLLRGMAGSGLKSLPAEWIDGIRSSLLNGNDETVAASLQLLRLIAPSQPLALELVSSVPANRKRNQLSWPAEQDYLLRSLLPAGSPLGSGEVTAAIADLNLERPSSLRSAAIELLTRRDLDSAGLVSLANALPSVPGIDAAKLLPAFAKSRDRAAGLALIAGLSQPAIRDLIRVEQVKPILDKYPDEVRRAADKLYDLLAEARRGERERLEKLTRELPPGDIRRGQIVFNGTKAQCIACHKIGYSGGIVGPDLTRIGGIRAERDLLESIVLPSASFVRSYEPVKVTTKAGRSVNGILRKDGPDEVILVVSADKEERIARAEIAEIEPGAVSIMPAGFDQNLSPQEIADLIAFLRACR